MVETARPSHRIGQVLRKHYFPCIAGLLLFLSVWGFSDNLIYDIGQPTNGDPKYVVHGLFCLAWMVVFLAQALLIRSRNVSAHRQLGIAAMTIAAGVTISTLVVFVSVWKGWDAMSPLVRANRLLLPTFTLFIALAFAHRRRPDRHKRFMLLGSLMMMEPILSRGFDPIEPLLSGMTDARVDLYWWVFFVFVWNALFASLAIYDASTDRRIHPITIAGYAWFCTIWGICWLT